MFWNFFVSSYPGNVVHSFEDECFKVHNELLVIKNHDVCNEEILVEDSQIVPEVGMKFKDVKEMFDFYKKLCL